VFLLEFRLSYQISPIQSYKIIMKLIRKGHLITGDPINLINLFKCDTILKSRL